jgi:hypothetical protein
MIKVQEYEMGMACSMHIRKEEYIQGFDRKERRKETGRKV